jgi:Carboxypeptidase regulatory-like domain
MPRISAIVLLMLLARAATAPAQITTGSVAGTVKDSQGAVVPGATVTLLSETRGTSLTPVTSSAAGDFVFVNIPADTYTIEIALAGFKSLRRSGVPVSAGDRIAVGTLTIEVGGATETVDVRGEAPVIQANSGERSFTIATDSVENLPIANRSFTALATLAPGVNGLARIGGGGTTFVMMDGISAIDTGSNGAPILQMNVESIAEVKMLTSNYQAEYGRSSGLQITAVTKSGTNRFRGSLYDVERNSDWNSNSRTNQLNGDPKPVTKERDWGFSIGGPVGKPGGNNRLFFFYAQEFSPRTAGNDVVRFRVPTALERAGDFSQTTDNLGNPYPYIKDPNLNGVCSAAGQAACFADGGVLGRIPASRLYQPGLNTLNLWPLPNAATAPGQAYNLEVTRPTEAILSWQPAIRVDYQPTQKLRATFKYSGWQQRNQIINGTLPGFNDTKMQRPVVSSWATTVNYTFGPTTFFEATYGRSQDELAGCPLAQQSTGPIFCTAAIPMGPTSDRRSVGLENLPLLFPDANVINPNYYAFDAFDMVKPDFWDGARAWLPPVFSWGNRVANAPPSVGITSYLNTNVTQDIALSLTRVAGRHTLKAGFYNGHALKSSNTQRGSTAFPGAPFGNLSFAQDTVGTNPFDTSFGFANAAIGSFSSYLQSTTFVETKAVYNNTEGYVQDNWKVNSRLTLDYGVRLVHQQPPHDTMGQASNFFPEKWTLTQAPLLYVAGCANGVSPCTGTNRQAMDPRTGQFLGANSSLAIGTLVPNTGDPTNGLIRQGQGIAETNFIWPKLAIAPRFGVAYDVTGKQRVVLRGGTGLFYDRPNASTTTPAAGNPPTSRNITVRYGQLQSLGRGGLTTEGPPALAGLWVYDPGGLPTSTQWNGGMQLLLPWAVSLDVSYVGQHSFNDVQTINLNAIDFGAAFLPENQDPTLPPSTTPGATAKSTDLLRAMPGYSTITQMQQEGWTTYHSIQIAFDRRFKNGVSFGFNDTISVSQSGNSAPRFQHNPDGSVFVRDDQAQADALLGPPKPQTHIMKANFVWDLPDLKNGSALRQTIGVIVNDWQLSGIWTGATGSPYAINFTYQSGGSSANLTGSPDYGARIRIAGDPGSGCSSDVYRQFETSVFQGPLVGSVGLESGNAYMKSCFSSVLDLSIARNIRLGGSKQIQLRVDMFNAPNAAIITGRNSTVSFTSPSDPLTAQNLPFDASGNLIVARSLPRGAGFGVANAYQAPRSVQAQVRFSF